MPPLPPQMGPLPAQAAAPLGAAPPGAISFEALAEIAAGATARVDLCRLLQPPGRAGGLVAVKRLHPHIAEDPTFVRQFLDEVRLTYWLHHPNVVEVAGWGSDEQGSYLAVELVQGVSLLRLMKTVFDTGEAFTERMVVYIAACICRGLGAAHSLRAPDGEVLNLVHRDLTPGNVLVGFNGEVKITDFGMAKAKQRLTKTLTGMRKGEPTYMAPEQARTDDIDARADLFSLGVLLFELFAGRRPWVAKNDFEMVQITTREPPADLRELRPKIDRELVNVVNLCLEREPGDRFQSAGEIAARLDEWLTVHGYQDDNAEALGRFVRRNAMRQMRWFERAIAGELLPERIEREGPPRVPTYTEHTPRPGQDEDGRSASAAPAVVIAAPRPLAPPRPAADPRSIRAANAVQQLKKLAPAIEPPRARSRPRVPTLDDGEATDVELKVGNPVRGGSSPRPRLPGVIIDADDESNEEVPTLVQRGDAKMQAFRAQARREQAARKGAAPSKPVVPPANIVDDESDGRVTAVKKDEPPSAGVIADPDSELPTAPRRLPIRDDSEAPTPIAQQPAWKLRLAIPPSPDIPPRPFPGGTMGAPAGPPPAEPPSRSTARPPPPPLPPAPPSPPPLVAPREPAVVAGPDPARTSHDDVQVIDRSTLQPRAAGLSEDALIAEADRLAIEAVRRTEEARAAHLRAERKAASAKVAEQAARIASEAVQMIRSAGLPAAIARLEEARSLEQHLQSGRIPGPEMGGQPPLSADVGAHPHSSNPPGYPVGPTPGPLSVPPQSVSLDGGGPRPPPNPPGYAVGSIPAPLSVPPVSYAPLASPVASPPAPRAPAPPPDPAPMIDPDQFRANLQPTIMGLPTTAVAVLAVVALVVVGVLVALLSK